MAEFCPQRALSPSDSGIDDDTTTALTPLCRLELPLPELKDDSSASMASSKEEVGLMPRSSRLTQSMFNRRPRLRPTTAHRDPEVMRERERRRMSLEHREERLESWTKDYMRQVSSEGSLCNAESLSEIATSIAQSLKAQQRQSDVHGSSPAALCEQEHFLAAIKPRLVRRT